MAVLLSEYLAATLKSPWRWGSTDCTIWVADWIYARTGIDPADKYRGTYANADECRALIQREGGFMPLVGMLMDEAGFDRTQSPADGDVGIISVPVNEQAMPVVGAIFAIRSADLWVARGLHGIRAEPWPFVTAWKIG
jgi:hypothetical protein